MSVSPLGGASLANPLGVTQRRQAAAFDPSADANLELWLDFADAAVLFTNSGGTTPVSADGDGIGSVRDKSANAYLLTATGAPQHKIGIINGKSVIQFAHSVNDYLTYGSIPTHASGDFYFATVVKRGTDIPNWDNMLLWAGMDVVTYTDHVTVYGVAGNLVGSILINAGITHLIEVARVGTRVTLYVDEVEDVHGDDATAFGSGTPFIGGDSFGDDGINAYGETIFSSSAVYAADYRTYLQTKWAV